MLDAVFQMAYRKKLQRLRPDSIWLDGVLLSAGEIFGSISAAVHIRTLLGGMNSVDVVVAVALAQQDVQRVNGCFRLEDFVAVAVNFLESPAAEYGSLTSQFPEIV